MLSYNIQSLDHAHLWRAVDQDGEVVDVFLQRKRDGPYIPCMHAILIAKKIVNEEIKTIGAHPCMDFIRLDEYLDGLKGMDISWEVE